MGFGRMTALSAVTALVGAGGLYATAAPAAGQERRVIVERDGDGPARVIVKGQDDAQDKGGRRVIVRKIRGGDGPGFDIFGMGGSRVGMVVRDVETADVTQGEARRAGGRGRRPRSVKESAAAEGRRQGGRRRDVVRRRARPERPSARAAGRGDARRPHGEGRAAARPAPPVTLDVTPEAPKMAQSCRAMPGQGADVLPLAEARPAPEDECEGPQGGRSGSRCRPGASTSRRAVLAAGRGRLGVRVQDLSEELAGYFGVKSGVLVAGVDAETPAAKAGVKAGDVITAVNGQAITEPGELRREVAKVEDGKTADLSVTRDKKALTLKVEVTATRPDRRTQDAPLAVAFGWRDPPR